MTATSAAVSDRSAGRCTSTPYPAAGRNPTRRHSPPSPASSSGSPTAPSCCSTDWSPRRLPRCLCPTRGGYAWSCSCTCRWVTARRMKRPRTPGGANARSSRLARPSSRPASGAGVGCWSCTSCPPDRVHVAAPGVDAADLATGTVAGGALLCVAAVTFEKGHDVLVEALRRSRSCPGSASASAASSAIQRSWRISVAAPVERGLDDRVSLPGTMHRLRSRPQLRRRGPDGAGVACRDVRHGRHGGSGPWAAGARRRRRRADGGAGLRRRRDPAWVAGPAATIQRHSARRSGRGSATPS